MLLQIHNASEMIADPGLTEAACGLFTAADAAGAYEAGGIRLREDGAVVAVDGRLVLAPEDVTPAALRLLG